MDGFALFDHGHYAVRWVKVFMDLGVYAEDLLSENDLSHSCKQLISRLQYIFTAFIYDYLFSC